MPTKFKNAGLSGKCMNLWLGANILKPILKKDFLSKRTQLLQGKKFHISTCETDSANSIITRTFFISCLLLQPGLHRAPGWSIFHSTHSPQLSSFKRCQCTVNSKTAWVKESLRSLAEVDWHVKLPWLSYDSSTMGPFSFLYTLKEHHYIRIWTQVLTLWAIINCVYVKSQMSGYPSVSNFLYKCQNKLSASARATQLRALTKSAHQWHREIYHINCKMTPLKKVIYCWVKVIYCCGRCKEGKEIENG